MSQTNFEPRLHFLISSSEIFKYEDQWLKKNPTERIIYERTVPYLITGLPKDPIKLLSHLKWHTPHPNGYGRRRKTSFVRHLIEKACAESQGKEECKTKLHIPNPAAITGVDDQNDFIKWIKLIDIVWDRKKMASIRYEDGYIYFEIFHKRVL